MNKNLYLHRLHLTIPASMFVVVEGLSAVPAMAGDGVVIIQREVPARAAYREGNPGRASSIDVSPDDKVRNAVNGQSSSLKSTELGDADFAAVSTGTPQHLSADISGVRGLSHSQLGNHGLGGSSNSSGAVQSLAPTITGSVGHAVGGATGNMAGGVNGVTNALSGLAGAVMRTGGQ